jgi:hypothetical protein
MKKLIFIIKIYGMKIFAPLLYKLFGIIIYDEQKFESHDNENDINNIRSYFNDILNRDKIVINSLKSNSIELFKNNIDNITPIENHKIVDFTN